MEGMEYQVIRGKTGQDLHRHWLWRRWGCAAVAIALPFVLAASECHASTGTGN
jgi:hypothetical protein